MGKDKLLGEERRAYILAQLQAAVEPISARALAEQTKVSRQVIVQDISLLKARDEPILATAQGYIFVRKQTNHRPRKVIVCKHTPEQSREELNLIVDHGVTILDVSVEHPLYGEITAALHIKSRKDVEQFIHQVKSKKASLLSELTEGVHLHTLEADTEQQILEACRALEKAGFLLTTAEE